MESGSGQTTSAPALYCTESEQTTSASTLDIPSVHSHTATNEHMPDSAVAGPSHVSDDDDDDVPPYTALFPPTTPIYMPHTANMCSSSISNENVNLYSLAGTLGTNNITETTSLALPVCESKSNLSDTASAVVPICRICHQPGEDFDILISPCRCAGTLQFIHSNCLTKWLEISSKKSRKPPKCELCHYQYNRHKKFKLSHWRFPRVSNQDKALHAIFVVNFFIMVICAIATVMCFLSDKGRINKFPRNKATLTTEEIITLSCGVLFFVSFFIAMSVQIKARRTLYQVFVKFIMQNMEWEIDEYDKSKDILYSHQKDPHKCQKSAMYV